jgi:hypothetical protein
MGTFMDHPVSRLVPGRSGRYRHWFGGPPVHRGAVPKGRKHSVHLLYDLDLRDPQLGLASRFPGLSRLPLYNALQYNCCGMIYRVVADDAIQILHMDELAWDPDHPYESYPASFKRTRVVAKPVSPRMVKTFKTVVNQAGGPWEYESYRAVLADKYLFPRVGGRHLMWQGIPEWECPTRGCRFRGRSDNDGKEVFAVIWERPVPKLHLWTAGPKHMKSFASIQIIFSRCTGCGVIHSCNRCD